MPAAVKNHPLFGGATDDPVKLAELDMAFKAEVDRIFADGIHGKTTFASGDGHLHLRRTDSYPSELETAIGRLTPDAAKAIGIDLDAVRGALNTNKGMLADIGKDITLNGGVGGVQPVAFDLEAPMKFLAPFDTPTVNRIPRTKGVGTSHRFKQLLAFTGSPGMPSTNPGFAPPSQTNWNLGGAQNTYLIRPPKIGYQSADRLVPYVQMGASDQVDWGMQYAAQGYQDVRALSQVTVMRSSKLMEEKALLYGRSSFNGTGYTGSGALAAPAAVTLAVRVAGVGEVGAAATTTVWVQVTSDAGENGPIGSGIAESVASTVATISVPAGDVCDVKIGTEAAGTLGYRVYVGSGASDPGTALHYYQGRTGYNTFTLYATSSVLATLTASPPAADTSAANAQMYDGIIPTLASGGLGAAGYVTRLNTAFSTATPGSEFQTAFAAVYDPGLGGHGARIDEILINSRDRAQMGKALQSSTGNDYRIVLQMADAGNAMLGVLAKSIVNNQTGLEVPMTTSLWLPQGNAVGMSYTVPVPDSQVTNVWEVVNVQDYMGIAWPVIQMTYDYSSYWFGALCCYAPAWNFLIQGIKAA